MDSITQSLSRGLDVFFSFIPQFIGAVVILIIGYFVAKLVQKIVTRILKAIGFERWMERGGVKKFFDRADSGQTPSGILGLVAFWFIFIISITMAVNALGIQQVTGFLNELIAYIPSIFAAILILLLAALLANFVAGIVRGATDSGVLAGIAQYAILIYAAFAALTELGIAVHLTSNTFLIILAGAALAAGLAFGLGGQGVAREMIENGYKRRNELRGGGNAAPKARSGRSGAGSKDSE